MPFIIIFSTWLNTSHLNNYLFACFQLQGSSGSMRPVDNSTLTFFATTQIRLTLDGFSGTASSYSILTFEVCSEECLDLVSSCSSCDQTATIAPSSTEAEPGVSSTGVGEAALMTTSEVLGGEQASSTAQNELQPSSTEESEEASTTQNELQPSSTEESEEASTTQNELQPSSTEESEEASTTQNELQPSSTEESEEASSTAQNELQPSSTEESEEASTTQNELQPSSTEESEEASTTQNELQPSSTEESEEASSTAQNELQPSSTEASEEASSTTQNELQPSSTEESEEASSTAQNELQPSSTGESEEASSTAQNELQPSSTEASDEEETVMLTETEISAVSTPSSQNEAVTTDLLAPFLTSSQASLATSNSLLPSSSGSSNSESESPLASSVFMEEGSGDDVPSSESSDAIVETSSAVEEDNVSSTTSLSTSSSTVELTATISPTAVLFSLVETTEAGGAETTVDFEEMETVSTGDDQMESDVIETSAVDEPIATSTTAVETANTSSAQSSPLAEEISSTFTDEGNDLQTIIFATSQVMVEVSDLTENVFSTTVVEESTEEPLDTSDLEEAMETSTVDLGEEPSISPSVVITGNLDSSQTSILLTPSPSPVTSTFEEQSLELSLEPSLVTEESESLETGTALFDVSTEIVLATQDGSGDGADTDILSPTQAIETDLVPSSSQEDTISVAVSPTSVIADLGESSTEAIDVSIEPTAAFSSEDAESSEEVVETEDVSLESTQDFGGDASLELSSIAPSPSPLDEVETSEFLSETTEGTTIEMAEVPLETTFTLQISSEIESFRSTEVGSGDMTEISSELVESTESLELPVSTPAIDEDFSEIIPSTAFEDGSESIEATSLIAPSFVVPSSEVSDDFVEIETTSFLGESSEIPEIEPTPSITEDEFSSEAFSEESLGLTLEASSDVFSITPSTEEFLIEESSTVLEESVATAVLEESVEVSDEIFTSAMPDVTEEITILVTPSEPFSTFAEATEDFTDIIEFTPTDTDTALTSSEELEEATNTVEILLSTLVEETETEGESTEFSFEPTPSLTIEASEEELQSTAFESSEELGEQATNTVEILLSTLVEETETEGESTEFSFEPTPSLTIEASEEELQSTAFESSEELGEQATNTVEILLSTPVEETETEGESTEFSFEPTPSLTIESSEEELQSTAFESAEESVEFTEFSIEPTPILLESTVELSEFSDELATFTEVDEFTTTEIDSSEFAPIETTDEFIFPSPTVESSLLETEEIFTTEFASFEIESSLEIAISTRGLSFVFTSGDFTVPNSIPSLEVTPFPSPSSSGDSFNFAESSSLFDIERTSLILTSEEELEETEVFSPTPTEFVEIDESSIFTIGFVIESSEVDVPFTSEFVATEEFATTEFAVASSEEPISSDDQMSTLFEFLETSLSSNSLVSLTPTPSPSPEVEVCNFTDSLKPTDQLEFQVLKYGFKAIDDESAPQNNGADLAATILPIPQPGSPALTRSSEVQVSLEGLLVDSITVAHAATDAIEIRGELFGSDIYVDRQTVVAAIQARYVDSNAAAEVEVTVLIRDLEFNCKTFLPDGFCTVSLAGAIPADWFLSDSDMMVPVTAMLQGQQGEQDEVSLGNVTLRANLPEHMPGSLYILGPGYPVNPGEEVVVQVYAAFDILLYVYSLDCMANGATIIDATTIFEWGLLTDRLDGRVSATGFRNYNQFNTSSTGMAPDPLFNLTLLVNEGSQPGTAVEVACNPIKLSFTDGSEVEGNPTTTAVNLEPEGRVAVFAHAPQRDLLNIPLLASEIDTEVPLSVFAFDPSGKISSAAASCHSGNESVLQVKSNCSSVYFDGSETSGAESVEIKISAENVSTSIFFRVFYVHEISLEVDDDNLNLIASSCLDSIYQRTPVSISGSAVTKLSLTPRRIKLNDYLGNYLISSNSKVANISDGSVIGLGEGYADIYLSNAQNVSIRVNVSSSPVCIYSLEVVDFSGVALIAANGSGQEFPHVSTSLLQEYQFIRSSVNLLAVATFSDGHQMRLSQEDGIVFQLSHESANQTAFNQFRISTPSNFSITALWTNDDCEIVKSEVSVAVAPHTKPFLAVDPSSAVLAFTDDLAVHFRIPTSLELSVSLDYPDRSIRIPPGDPALSIVCPSLLTCAGVTVEATPSFRGEQHLQVYYNTSKESLSNRSTIVAEYAADLELELWISGIPCADAILHQIGSSGKFQMAFVQATLIFSTNRTVNVTSNTTLVFLSSPLDVDIDMSQLNEKLIMASTARTTAAAANTTLQGTLEIGSGNISGNLMVTFSENNLQVKEIGNITLTESPRTNEIFIDFAVTLTDNSSLTQTFNNGTALYPNLTNFSLSDIVVSVSTSGILTLLNNSASEIILTASSNMAQQTASFYSNLKPVEGQADLGENSLNMGPLKSTEPGKSFTVPLTLNSGTSNVGVYRVDIRYSPASLLEKVDRVEQGENWRNGTLVYYETPGLVSIGGVLNTGAKGTLVELAKVTFIASSTCTDSNKVIFTVEVVQLFATVSLDSITTVASSSIELEILSCSSRRKRSAESSPHHHHSLHRRQAGSLGTSSVSGDFNNDNVVDLRDLYLVQQLISIAVYNTTFRNISVSEIAAIEQSSLSLSFNASVDYSFHLNSFSECILQINGTIFNSDDSSSVAEINTDSVHVLLQFSSDDSSFLDGFEGYNSVGSSRDGLVEPDLSPSGFFQIAGNTSSSSVFKVTVFLIVETGEPSGDALGLVSSFSSTNVTTIVVSDEEGSCILLPSTSVLPSPTFSSSFVSESVSPTSEVVSLTEDFATSSVETSFSQDATSTILQEEPFSSLSLSLSTFVPVSTEVLASSEAETNISVQQTLFGLSTVPMSSSEAVRSTASDSQIAEFSSATSTPSADISIPSLRTMSVESTSVVVAISTMEQVTSRVTSVDTASLVLGATTSIMPTSRPVVVTSTENIEVPMPSTFVTSSQFGTIMSELPSVATSITTSTLDITSSATFETSRSSFDATSNSLPSTTAITPTRQVPSTSSIGPVTTNVVPISMTAAMVTSSSTTAPMIISSSTAAPMVAPSSTAAPVVTPSSTAATMVAPSSTAAPMVTPSSTAAPMVAPSSTAAPMVAPSSTAAPMVTPSSTAAPMVAPSSTAAPMVAPSSTAAPMVAPSSTAAPMVAPSSNATAAPMVTLSSTAAPMVAPSSSMVTSISAMVAPSSTTAPMVDSPISTSAAMDDSANPTNSPSSGVSTILIIVFVIMAVVVVILVFLIAIVAFVIRRQRNGKGGYSPNTVIENHRLTNRQSGDFFYIAEEGIVSWHRIMIIYCNFRWLNI